MAGNAAISMMTSAAIDTTATDRARARWFMLRKWHPTRVTCLQDLIWPRAKIRPRD
jgi:hypothetical protein